MRHCAAYGRADASLSPSLSPSLRAKDPACSGSAWGEGCLSPAERGVGAHDVASAPRPRSWQAQRGGRAGRNHASRPRGASLGAPLLRAPLLRASSWGAERRPAGACGLPFVQQRGMLARRFRARRFLEARCLMRLREAPACGERARAGGVFSSVTFQPRDEPVAAGAGRRRCRAGAGRVGSAGSWILERFLDPGAAPVNAVNQQALRAPYLGRAGDLTRRRGERVLSAKTCRNKGLDCGPPSSARRWRVARARRRPGRAAPIGGAGGADDTGGAGAPPATADGDRDAVGARSGAASRRLLVAVDAMDHLK